MEPIDAETDHTTPLTLLVNATEAGDLAERLTGWYLLPVDGKIPMCPWQSTAATGREDVEALWRKYVGADEQSGVAIACDRSGIFVIDEDRDWRSDEASAHFLDWREWATAIDTCDSLVLASSGKGRPHYYFRQPSDAKVAERTFPGGDVKSKGIIVLASTPPIYQPSAAGGGVWTPADVKEAIPPLINLIGTRRTVDGEATGSTYQYHRVTKEEFSGWLDQEPGEHFGGRLISEDYEDSFITKLTDRLRQQVDSGASRRTSTLNAVHAATIESLQGLYSLRAAYDALHDVYEELRTFGPGECSGDKGWTQQRADDFQGMWDSEIAKPDALRQAEASYDELVGRLGSSGVSMEISEEDAEEDAFIMDVIFTASEEQDTVAPPPPPPPLPTPDPTPTVEPEPVTDDEAIDAIDWEGITDDPAPAPPTVPTAPPTKSPIVLGADAQRGVLWDLASGLVGKHELPHEALMVTLAGWAGCVLGSVGAGSMMIGEDRHGPELCVCMVGTSAVSHKSGTVFFGHMVFNEWYDVMETGVGAPGVGSGFFREVSGIESGQAFIEVWPTAADIAGGEGVGRAVMMVESELTTMWKKAARKGSTIPEEVRKAWDGSMLAVRGVRAGNHRVLPANYRFSAVGATIHTLAARTIVESGADISGDGNRWLWCWGQEVPKPVKGLPSFDKHPLVVTVRDQVRGLIQSVERARNEGWWPGSALGPGGVPLTEFGEPKLWWSPEADQLWLGDEGTDRAGKGVYADLRAEVGASASGSAVVRQLKARGAQQVMRLAIGYEMLKAGSGWAGLVRDTLHPDGQSWCLSREALEWAVAVWRYCADTVEHLFSNMTGDAKVDELVSAIREIGKDQGKRFQGFVLKADIVGNGFSKNTITHLISVAEEQGAVWQGTIRREGRGASPVVLGLPEWTPPAGVLRRVR